MSPAPRQTLFPGTDPNGIAHFSVVDSGSQVFNVQNELFGATGDGVTDDMAAIQRAITAATASGGTVFLPAATYIISRPLVLYEKVRLLGVGQRGSTIKAAATFSGGVAMIINDTSVLMQHLFIEKLELLGSNVSNLNGILVDGPGQPSYIRDVEVNQMSGGYAIKVQSTAANGAIAFLIENVSTASGLGDHGIILGQRCIGCIVRNFAGQTMPAGKASVAIDGTGGASANQQNMLYEIHHESTAHGGYAVYCKNTTAPSIFNVYSALADATDTMVYLDTGTFGAVARHISAGGLALNVINDTVNGIILTGFGSGLSSQVEEYVQPSTGGSNGRYGSTFFADRDQVSADQGDASVGFTPGADAPVIVFNTPLGNTRQLTLNIVHAYHGCRCHVVRTAAATGAFNLQVQDATPTTLKLMPLGSWADFRFNGTAWFLTAYGTL